jgi:hypothetical protein
MFHVKPSVKVKGSRSGFLVDRRRFSGAGFPLAASAGKKRRRVAVKHNRTVETGENADKPNETARKTRDSNRK